MLYPFRSYLRDRWIFGTGLLSIVVLLFLWWYTISKISPTNDQLFLHYNILFGVDMIGEWWRVYFISVFALVIFLVNFGISYFCYQQNRFASRLLGVITVFFEVLIMVGGVLIVGLNI